MPKKALLSGLMVVLVFTRISFCQTTMLTGQASQQVQLAPGDTLQYISDIAAKTQASNELSPVSWCGLGWKYGVPSISVIHNNTTDLNDDRWLYDDGYGNFSEIIRVFESTQEKFYIKLSPLQKVTVVDNSPGSGQLRVIKGWEIKNIDGTTSRFGYVSGQSEDAMLYIPRWGNYIGRGKTGLPTPDKFYYRWNLKEVEDVNHQKTAYSYQSFSAQTSTGYAYIKEAYLQQITTPIGDKTVFELSTRDKDINEGPMELFIGDFDFSETKYLRRVTLKDRDDKVLELVNLNYSGDPGETNHFKYDKKGFAKRLLTRISYTYSKGKDRIFAYDASNAHLVKLTNPQQGSAVSYTYANKPFKLNKEYKTGFSQSDWDNANIQTIGNHIFCWHSPTAGQSTTMDKLEIFDKIGNEWVKTDIDDITDFTFSSGARFYPYADRFVINYKVDNYTSRLKMFQWIDNAWRQVYETGIGSSAPINLDNTTVKHAPSYVLIYNPNLTSSESIKVIGKTPNTESWALQASFTAVNGGKPVVEVARDYFLYSFTGSYNGTADYRQVKVYRNDGAGWAEHVLSGRVMYYEGTNNCQMFAFDDYFIIAEVVSSGATDMAIRRWNPSSSQWMTEYFENTGLTKSTELGSFTWPRRADLYCGNGYAVVIEPANDNWMMIYRYMNQGSGSYIWTPTFITATGTCNAPTIASSAHAFNGTSYYYAKDFQTSTGDVSIRSIQCTDRHFFVNGDDASYNYFWDFRWTGDENASANSAWVSKLNGYPAIPPQAAGVDNKCQGWRLDKNTFSYLYSIVNSDNLCVYSSSSYIGEYTPYVFIYNYESGAFEPGSLNFGERVKPSQGNDVACHLWSLNPNPTIEIFERYLGSFTQANNIKAVSNVLVSDVLGNQVSASYDYAEGKQLFDTYKGTGIFSLVSSWIGDGTKAGKSTTEFCLDSTLGIYGQVFATSQHSSSAASIPNDDTVRISGWLMELDGFTPKSGWVAAGLYSGPGSNIVKIDPQTGYFQTKLYNPSQLQCGLYHLVTSDGSVNSAVFWIYRDVNNFWRLDYAGRTGEMPLYYSKPYNWQNVKINYGIQNSRKLTIWNQTRRPNAMAGTYNFYGVKKQQLGSYASAPLSRLVRTVAVRDGVAATTAMPFEYFDEHNNLPAVSYSVNSDGKARLVKTIFAHEKFADMGTTGACMLTQPAGTVTYAADSPSRVEWENNTVYAIGPTQDPYAIPLFTSQTLSEMKAGDKISLSVAHNLTQNYTDPLVTFTLKVNNASRSSANSRDVTWQLSPPQTVTVEYQLQNSDIPVSTMNLIVDNVDYTLEVRKTYGYVYKSIQFTNDRAVSASAATWKNPEGIWRPETSWAWNVPMTSAGLPGEALNDFVYSNPLSNQANKWQIPSIIDRYSPLGKPIQMSGPAKAPVVGMMRNDLGLLSGKISNAIFAECGVFTGDYKAGSETGYWDYQNGWEKGSAAAAELVSDAANVHFGQKSIHVVNDYAAGRNNQVIPGKSYIMSAWVKVTSGRLFMAAGYHYRDNANQWPVVNMSAQVTAVSIDSVSISSAQCAGQWKLLQLTIPASRINQLASLYSGKVYYARAWVGNKGDFGNAQGVNAYVDDVRFYPADALPTTTFYDSKWRQPIMSVDANDNPSHKAVYDDFGRPIEERKIDKYNPSSTTLIKSMKYHLMGDCETPTYSNNYETGNLDIAGSECGGPNSIVTGGYNSGHSIRISNNYSGCVLWGRLNLAASAYNGKMCAIQGYYKSDKPLSIGINSTTTGNSAAVGGANFAASSEWQLFTVFFDLRSLTWTPTNVEVIFSDNSSGAVFYYWIDDLKVCALY
jgi:hypothetical protein